MYTPALVGFHQALRDVAWQITRVDPRYADHVSSQCRTYTDIETLPSAWRKLFTSYFVYGGSTSLYLIIDGLDEAEEDSDYGGDEFLRLIADLQGMYGALHADSASCANGGYTY
jgi:hypothetical protein